MFSAFNSQYLNELISEMSRLSEVPIDCKNAQILLTREIARVFDEIQKGGGFGEVRTPTGPMGRGSNAFLPKSTSTPYQAPTSRNQPASPFSFSKLSKNQFITPIKPTAKSFSMNPEGDWQEKSQLMMSPQFDNEPEPFVLQTKIYIPDAPKRVGGKDVKYNYIGRILGPSGMSARAIEKQFGVTLLIRGAGSVRHITSEELLKGKKGYEHLDEPLHVLLIARHADRTRCEQILDSAATKIESLLTPVHDDYKKEQLVSFAIMNGTYEERPNNNKKRLSMDQRMMGF